MINVTDIAAAGFSVSEAKTFIFPLLIFIVGVTIYAIFIFHFYRFVAHKDVLKLNLHEYSNKFVGMIANLFFFILYILEYIILFPIFIFFWFGVLSIMLLVLAKTTDIGNVLLITMSLVSAIRITAYYNEDLSKDLAKMLPFALLGVFLIDVSFFSIDKSISMLMQIPTMIKPMAYYFLFVVGLEVVLRVLSFIIPSFGEVKEQKGVIEAKLEKVEKKGRKK